MSRLFVDGSPLGGNLKNRLQKVGSAPAVVLVTGGIPEDRYVWWGLDSHEEECMYVCM